MKMVRDTPPSQDVSTLQNWNSYLKEYRKYGADTKAERTDGLTDGQTDGRTDGRTDSAITICLPKFLWGHKNMKPVQSYTSFIFRTFHAAVHHTG